MLLRSVAISCFFRDQTSKLNFLVPLSERGSSYIAVHNFALPSCFEAGSKKSPSTFPEEEELRLSLPRIMFWRTYPQESCMARARRNLGAGGYRTLVDDYTTESKRVAKLLHLEKLSDEIYGQKKRRINDPPMLMKLTLIEFYLNG